MKHLLPIVGILAIAATTGCGGSGGGGGVSTPAPVASNAPANGFPAAPPPGVTTTPGSSASAIFTIRIPGAGAPVTTASKTRRPDYVSIGTQSIQISLSSLNNSPFSSVAPVKLDLTVGDTEHCKSTANGGANLQLGSTARKTLQTTDSSLLCTIEFPTLPVGTDGFTLVTYDKTVENTPAPSDALSTNVVTAPIYVGTVSNIPVTLAGIISKLSVTLDQGTAPDYTNWLSSGTLENNNKIIITADDASGAQIIGSFPYQNVNNVTDAINISTNDVLGTIALATTTEPDPTTQSIDTYNYSGVALADGTDHITVADALDSTISATVPIHVKATPIDLTIDGVPLDALPLTFPSTYPLGGYSAQAGNDMKMVLTATETGWGTSTNPFTESQTCTGLNVALSGVGNSTVTITGLASQQRQPACTVTIGGGAAQSDVINFMLTGSANGGNFQVQSIQHKG